MASVLCAWAICTLAEVKTWLGITESTYDNHLEYLINAVTDMIENHIGRRVIARHVDGTGTDIVEIFSGDGSNFHYVDNPPIHDLTSIAIEDETAPNITPSADEVRWDATSGLVQLISRVFSVANPLNCTVTYEGGWTTAPVPIWQVCREEVKRLHKIRAENMELVLSISGQNETVSYVREKGLSEDAKAKLAPYVVRHFA